MSCAVGKATEGLANESSFSNLSVTSPTSQLILQPFRRFIYVTGSSLTSPNEPPMLRVVGCDGGNWIALAEDRDQWLAYVRVLMNLRVL